MKIIRVFFFYAFLSLLLLPEGLGIKWGREVTFLLLLVIPSFLYLFDLPLARSFILPKKVTIIYGLFLLFSFVSTLMSMDFYRSLRYFFFYVDLFLVFLYFYNHADTLRRWLIPFIYGISFVYAIYSLFFQVIIRRGWEIFIPENGYQFVFSRFGSHNHLGDILIIPLLISLYSLYEGKKNRFFYVSSLLFFSPFFFLSFSRSAYLDLILGVLLLLFYQVKKKGVKIKRPFVITAMLVVFLCSIFFFSTVKEYQQVPIVGQVHTFLVNRSQLLNKEVIGERDLLAQDAIFSWMEKPFFGVGLNNYVYISGSYSTFPKHFSLSSHNIFLDMLVENGLIAGILFIAFIFYCVIIKPKGYDRLFFLLFLAVLFNFQTDYTFTIYGMFLLFFIILAAHLSVSHTEVSSIADRRLYYPIIFFAAISLLYAQWLILK